MNREEVSEKIVELAREELRAVGGHQRRRVRLVITDLHRFKPPVQVSFIKIVDEAHGYRSLDKRR